MKAILMSIQPKWCEKIFSGEMTIKVCKSAPKLETPFKVYVYCTKERMTRMPSMYAYLHKNEPRACAEYGTIETWGEIGDVIVNPHLASKHVSFGMHGKVVGEFVCCAVEKYDIDLGGNYYRISDKDAVQACVDQNLLFKYGNGRDLYGWHISEPKLYDKPKELEVFRKPCDFAYDCCACQRAVYKQLAAGEMIFNECNDKITRPPSSWCYVGEVER